MKKEQLQPNQKASPLALRKETLRRLADADLQGVAGAARVRITVGFDDDTTPIYSEMEMP
ncbi:MAG TPA: hypothetical protein VKM72_22180 [Thermoanaerobaculia bacterium]|nr:hypothetical protein [Thermoanaerobaculia bacterium]